MSNDTTTSDDGDEEPTTWTDESRQRVNLRGERSSMHEQTLQQVERRRDGTVPAAHDGDEDSDKTADLASVDRKHGGDL
ncbi:hypothetical protein [Halobacterium rubrum]|uniref:hypothetical protein n=1 Tax=Halobacterium TaxID=2239 RepID=UPI001F26A4A8|nr:MULTISPECIES: hypothetical protein [Halobacterium]MDH5019032.1 hypothetical protein [Halobacterium rubrum]